MLTLHCQKRFLFFLYHVNPYVARVGRVKTSSYYISMSTFCLNDYDCVGFDLDHTLCRYKLDNLFQLIYTGLNKFLVEKKGYPSQLLAGEKRYDDCFLHKGLLLDSKKGNLLKIGNTGVILRASHGTKMMSRSEIVRVYGCERLWPPFDTFKSNMYEGRGKLGREVRSFKDYFDMPAALVAARLVDVIDSQRTNLKITDNTYQFWPDILDGLIELYRIEGFAKHSGGFFPSLKEDLESYVSRCSNQVRLWLRKLHQDGKLVFMVTGSNFDFASHLAEHCLGADWRGYFDVVVTHAGKPGFFNGHRDFLYTDGEPVPSSSKLKQGGMYCRGNYAGLTEFFASLTGADDPRVVYYGDNLIQDVFTPAKYCRCDAVAIVEEMEREGMCGEVRNTDKYPGSKWGSFFCDDEPQGNKNSEMYGAARVNTLWAEVILTHSRIAIPSLDAVAGLPLDTKFQTFDINNPQMPSGFYPTDPKSLHI